MSSGFKIGFGLMIFGLLCQITAVILRLTQEQTEAIDVRESKIIIVSECFNGKAFKINHSYILKNGSESKKDEEEIFVRESYNFSINDELCLSKVENSGGLNQVKSVLERKNNVSKYLITLTVVKKNSDYNNFSKKEIVYYSSSIFKAGDYVDFIKKEEK